MNVSSFGRVNQGLYTSSFEVASEKAHQGFVTDLFSCLNEIFTFRIHVRKANETFPGLETMASKRSNKVLLQVDMGQLNYKPDFLCAWEAFKVEELLIRYHKTGNFHRLNILLF